MASTNRAIPGTRTAKMGVAPKGPRPGRLGHAPRVTQVRNLKGHFGSGFGVNWVGLEEVAMMFALASSLPERTEQIMRETGEKAITWAKANAAWEDQTGEARGAGKSNDDQSSLHYAVLPESNGTFSLHVAHGPTYGVYLEANPEYAILAAALLHASGIVGPIADAEMQKHLGRYAL